MLGWALTALPAQVGISLVLELVLKMQPPQPGCTPGSPASTQPPAPPYPPHSGGFNFLSKVF